MKKVLLFGLLLVLGSAQARPMLGLAAVATAYGADYLTGGALSRGLGRLGSAFASRRTAQPAGLAEVVPGETAEEQIDPVAGAGEESRLPRRAAEPVVADVVEESSNEFIAQAQAVHAAVEQKLKGRSASVVRESSHAGFSEYECTHFVVRMSAENPLKTFYLGLLRGKLFNSDVVQVALKNAGFSDEDAVAAILLLSDFALKMQDLGICPAS